MCGDDHCVISAQGLRLGRDDGSRGDADGVFLRGELDCEVVVFRDRPGNSGSSLRPDYERGQCEWVELRDLEAREACLSHGSCKTVDRWNRE